MANPKVVREWVKIGRDITIVVIASFLLVWEAVFVANPNALVIGAGLTLLGLPVALRLDQVFRTVDDGDDPFEGPGGYYRE